MKTVIVYSGKGGSGKTTTAVNLARIAVEQGYKVCILDADVTTPSVKTACKDERIHIMSTEIDYENPANLSNGAVKMWLVNKVKFLTDNPNTYDLLLVDTPPSITDTHFTVFRMFKNASCLMVTQNHSLSRHDNVKGVEMITKSKIPIIGTVVTMCYMDYELQDGEIGFIPLHKDGLSSDKPFRDFHLFYEQIFKYFSLVGKFKGFDFIDRESPYDETITFEKHLENHYTGRWGGKPTYLPFINLRTLKEVIDYNLENSHYGFAFGNMGGGSLKDRFTDSGEVHIRRLVDAFKNTDQALFTIVKAPVTEVRLIAGEVGIGTLVNSKAYGNVPCIQYNTRQGQVLLFPTEVLPMDEKAMQQLIKYDEHIFDARDNRYFPKKYVVEQMYHAFGTMCGLGEDWETIYDNIVGTDEQKESTYDYPTITIHEYKGEDNMSDSILHNIDELKKRAKHGTP